MPIYEPNDPHDPPPSTLVEMRRLLGALTAEERAAVARLVIHEHLAVLRTWPAGPPATYMTDFKIGEYSAIQHCQKIAGRLEIKRSEILEVVQGAMAGVLSAWAVDHFSGARKRRVEHSRGEALARAWGDFRRR